MDEIRVGDAERSDALDRLGTLFADGYLDVGEFEAVSYTHLRAHET